MTREEIIEMLGENLKIVRTEAGYTQDRMAEIIGISKKTLVQIEKGRILPGWTTVIAVCALFSMSQVLQTVFGGDPLEVVEMVAREKIDVRKERTMGGKVWWKTLERHTGLILQQNLITKHYRIIDDEQFRLYSSFDEKDSRQRFIELQEK
ncbi:helix-turn-helix transcriptional regulator [Falsibacillus pallidus]|uniref:helix-turn-helix transcriptional regulator n=1 Tax=Falsibacillus pallidus TaxID=493781 RepID=UPI003D98504F